MTIMKRTHLPQMSDVQKLGREGERGGPEFVLLSRPRLLQVLMVDAWKVMRI